MKAIPQAQIAAYESLTRKFNVAHSRRDLSELRKIVSELTPILRPIGQESRLNKFKLFYFELAFDLGYTDKAKEGFAGIKKRTKMSRIHIEASGLLAICYLREGNLKEAKPLMQYVLSNQSIIKTTTRRLEFKRVFMRCFEQEGVVGSLRGLGRERLTVEGVAEKASVLAEKDNKEILSQLGEKAPGEAFLFGKQLKAFIKKQLPSSERLLLTDKEVSIDAEQLGCSLFDAFKRQLYDGFCNPNSDTYKNFFDRPLKGLAWSTPIATHVVQVLRREDMCWWVLAVPLVSLFTKLGINTLCVQYKPRTIMIDRR